uniref:APC basic domain protein n=1 Tax=Pithovirus LCPAC401 TaxID=2506595 RepID=A0A481ZCQ1_9VIRU|nr:MAG: APC basic domain protein [Pithovirus LCPAC401]
MRFVINDTVFDINPKDLSTGSTLATIYEGDPYANEFRINNSSMSSESIQLVIDVINKDITHHKLLASDINWEDLIHTVNYLNLRVSIDFIYPLFLTIEDRIEWYRTCETRQTHICGYSEDESKYVFGGVKEEEELIYVSYDDMKIRDSDYDVIDKSNFREAINTPLSSKNVDIIFEELSLVPNLFVAGGYPLAKFDRKHRGLWSDIDIFAYGDNSLEHIKEGVRICIEIANEKRTDYHLPVRTRYSITIPIVLEVDYGRHELLIQFILIKSQNKSQILNRFDIDASCIGFDIGERSKFLVLPRFIRAFETRTNITDPTRQSPTYIKRLAKYAGKGFNIAVPGFELDKIKLSPNIMKQFVEFTAWDRNKGLKNMNLTGLQGLVTSAFAKSNMTKGRLTTPEEISDYGYVTTHNVLFSVNRLAIGDKPFVLNKGSPISFVVGDVLNEGSRPFEIEAIPQHSFEINIFTYVPKYPIIELIDDDPQNGMIGSIHQVKSSFYGEYYGIVTKSQAPIRSVSPPRKSFRSLRAPITISRETQTSPLKRSSKISKPIIRSSRIRSSSRSRIVSRSREISKPISRPSRIRTPSKFRVSSKSRIVSRSPEIGKPSRIRLSSKSRSPHRTSIIRPREGVQRKLERNRVKLMVTHK